MELFRSKKNKIGANDFVELKLNSIFSNDFQSLWEENLIQLKQINPVLNEVSAELFLLEITAVHFAFFELAWVRNAPRKLSLGFSISASKDPRLSVFRELAREYVQAGPQAARAGLDFAHGSAILFLTHTLPGLNLHSSNGTILIQVFREDFSKLYSEMTKEIKDYQFTS